MRINWNYDGFVRRRYLFQRHVFLRNLQLVGVQDYFIRRLQTLNLECKSNILFRDRIRGRRTVTINGPLASILAQAGRKRSKKEVRRNS